MLIRLTDCHVSYKDEMLFKPEYGVFDMAIGKEIISAFAGAADMQSFQNLYTPSPTLTIKHKKSEEGIELENLYRKVRLMRTSSSLSENELSTIFEKLESYFPADWLLATEILELSQNIELKNSIISYLTNLTKKHPKLKNLIDDALKMANTIL
jgi:phenylalanine-4-hydroxylase